MTLTVLGRYRSGLGSFEPGQTVDVDPELEALLLRDSPGSFVLAGSAPTPPGAAEPAGTPDEDDEDDFDPTGAMSTENAFVAPDRRARGGRRRTE